MSKYQSHSECRHWLTSADRHAALLDVCGQYQQATLDVVVLQLVAFCMVQTQLSYLVLPYRPGSRACSKYPDTCYAYPDPPAPPTNRAILRTSTRDVILHSPLPIVDRFPRHRRCPVQLWGARSRAVNPVPPLPRFVLYIGTNGLDQDVFRATGILEMGYSTSRTQTPCPEALRRRHAEQ